MDQPPSSITETTVLIIGGGIGGLTLAAILRRLSIPFLVLERSPKITAVGAGISLAPNCLRVLSQLGIYQDIQREGQKLNKIGIYENTSLWRYLDWTLCERWFKYPVYSIERTLFHELLHKIAGGDEFIRLDSNVVDLVDDQKDDFVRVRTADGCEFHAKTVVGADGIRSVTRRMLARNSGLPSSTSSIKFTGRVHMSGYTNPLPDLGQEDLGVAHWMFYKKSILTTWPCKDNAQWFIGVKAVDPTEKIPDRSVWNGTTKETINEIYGKEFHPFAKSGKVEDIVNTSKRVIASNVFQEISFPSMSSGRVALLGDAAHSMTSFFGQGACQAIEDATELANTLAQHFCFNSYILAAPYSDNSLPEALKAYSVKREVRGKAISKFSANYAKVHTAQLPYGLGPAVRRVIFGWAPAWFWMWCLIWLYGEQPVVDSLPKPQVRV